MDFNLDLYALYKIKIEHLSIYIWSKKCSFQNTLPIDSWSENGLNYAYVPDNLYLMKSPT